MGADRFDPRTGYPQHVRIAPVSEKEREMVALARAHWEAAKRVYGRREARVSQLRRMLAGPEASSLTVTHADGAPVTEEAKAAGASSESMLHAESNLFLISQTKLKSEASDEMWGVRYPVAGDVPDEIVDEIETFGERLAVEAEVTQEFSDALDDGGTCGSMVIWMGCDRLAVNREKAAGNATPISELVLSAANGDDVHPLPGMDYLALAQAARDFKNDPDQQMRRTIEQFQNLDRLAQEADQAWADAMEREPWGYEYGRLRTRRLVYGEDVLWDARTTTRWQDAEWVGIRKWFPLEDAVNEEAFKPSARKALAGAGVEMPRKDGFEPLASEGAYGEEAKSWNKGIPIIEFWWKRTGTVHYFTEGAGNYEGFLERDSRYPYFDAKGRSVLKDWFPIRACTPVVHNLRIPERTQGVPWLEPGKADAIRYNLFDQALTASRSKAGAIIEVPEDLPDDKLQQIESGAYLTVIPRPAEMDKDKDLIRIHEFGKAPVDWMLGKQDALRSYARKVNMTVEEISGESIEPTLGQAELASRGATSARGGLIRKIQAFAGEIVSDLMALARSKFTEEQVTAIMGPQFTARYPQRDPTGRPVINPKTGKAATLPSIWDLFRSSSFAGDRVEVVFSPTDANLMQQKAESDDIALLTGPANLDPLNPPYPLWDSRPAWERWAKSRRLGRLKPFPVPPPPEAPEGEGGDGSPPNGKSKGGGQSGPPNGQKPRQDGRKAGDQRGAPAIANRQDRGEMRKSDVGDQSVRVNRVSTQ